MSKTVTLAEREVKKGGKVRRKKRKEQKERKTLKEKKKRNKELSGIKKETK